MPVLINYPGWLTEIIHQHCCGVAALPKSAAAFSDALEQLAEMSPEERRNMGRRGRALAEREFSREKLAGSFVEFLEQTAVQT